jgi:hypothetical protein
MLRNILLYSFVGLIVATIALILSYTLWTSWTWYWAYGAVLQNGVYRNLGSQKELYRMGLLVIFFILAQSFLFSRTAKAYWQDKPGLFTFYRNLFPIAPKITRRLVYLALFATIIYHLTAGPYLLHSESVDAFGPLPLSFQDYFLPYITYMPYSLVIYMMIALPMFIVIAKEIREDRENVRDAVQLEEESVDPGSLGTGEEIELEAVKIEKSILDLRENVVGVIDKYVAMAMLVVIYYGIEIGGGLIFQLACWAQVVGKWAAWLFIIAVLPYFIFTNYAIYTRAHTRKQEDLRALADRALQLGQKEALDTVNGIRGEFQTKYTVSSFVWSLKSASLAAFAFLAFFAFGRSYVQGLDAAEQRELLVTSVPWPVSPVVQFGADLLGGDPTSPDGSLNVGGIDWGLRCTLERPAGDLEWRGQTIDERAASLQ